MKMALFIIGILILVAVAIAWPNGGGESGGGSDGRPKQRVAWGHPIGDPDGSLSREEYERKRAALEEQIHQLDEDQYWGGY